MSMERAQQWAVAYDISVNRERVRVEKVLRGWGHRVQKSVFLVTVSRGGMERLKVELERLKVQSGTILFMRLLSDHDPVAIGQPWIHPDAGAAYVV